MTDKITTIQPESKFTREFVYTLMKLTKREQIAVKNAFIVWDDEEYWYSVNSKSMGSVIDGWVRRLTEWGGTE